MNLIIPIMIYTLCGSFVFFPILYFVIKAAVKNGIKEANKPRPQTICTQCGKLYDMVFPKCPHCNHWRT